MVITWLIVEGPLMTQKELQVMARLGYLQVCSNKSVDRCSFSMWAGVSHMAGEGVAWLGVWKRLVVCWFGVFWPTWKQFKNHDDQFSDW